MLSDQPIQTAKDDLLERAGFAKQIAAALLAAPPGKKGSFAMGLCGAWGSGKTSVLNMVMETLRKKKGDTPVIVQFNPWQYPADALLPGQFLQQVSATLLRPAYGKKLHKIGKAMEKYAAALQICTPAFTYETVGELRGKKKAPKPKGALPRSVRERKDTVSKLLKKQKTKIFVILDDIDRLPADRILSTLQLMKAVAPFPRFVYLLAYDEDVVIKALNTQLHDQGFAYMKKFIQVQFTVPAPGSGRIQRILTTYCKTWMKMQPNLNFDPAYFQQMAPYLFSCFDTIRDVYRFVNTFRVRYQALGNEVNFVDLLAVTALQLHSPKALSWMQSHRNDLLRGGGPAFRGENRMQRKRLQEEHRRLLLSLSSTADQTLIPLLSLMFPRYGKNVLDMSAGEQSRQLVRMRRICCEEFFDLYFTQSTEGLTITQEEIMRTIRELDAAGLRDYTNELETPERRGAYLSHLPHYLHDIPEEKLTMFFTEMLWLSRLPESKIPADKPFQRSFFPACCYCALRILAAMPGDMRLQSLQEAVSQADKHTIPALITLLTRIRDHHPDAENIVIDEDMLRVNLRQLMNKIHAIALKGSWLTSHKPLPVLEHWQQADAVSFRVYFHKLLQEDPNAALLISALTRRFDTGENMEYQYGGLDGLHAFSEEFPRSRAKAALERLRGTDSFRALPEEVQLDCVAFSLMGWDQNRASHKEVLAALPAWLQPADDNPATQQDKDES